MLGMNLHSLWSSVSRESAALATFQSETKGSLAMKLAFSGPLLRSLLLPSKFVVSSVCIGGGSVDSVPGTQLLQNAYH